jgi:hypothetical protein
MEWLAVATGLVKLLGAFAKWLGDRQLIKAGEAQAIAEGTDAILDRLAKSKQAADAMDAPHGADAGVWSQRVRDRFGNDKGDPS